MFSLFIFRFIFQRSLAASEFNAMSSLIPGFLFIPVLPLSVKITSEQRPLSADRVYDIHCVTFGSRPSALVTWWLGSIQLLDHSSQVRCKKKYSRVIK